MLMRKFGLWVLLWVGMLSFWAQGEELRVLMIGNSYTFYNRLPDALMALSRRTDCPLQVDSYTAGAMSLRGFLDSPEHAKARQMLASGDYDWVVLQDQSQTPADKPEETLHAVRRWAELAKAQDTRVLLFLTWAHASGSAGRMVPMENMQERTSATYCRAAVENGARVAPVGEAWSRWYRQFPGKALHARDCSHPNAEGTYLAACVLHGALSGSQLRSVPATLKLGQRVVLQVPGSSAAALQKTANASLKAFKSPRAWLEKQEKKDARRVSPQAAKEALKKGMKADELVDLLGKPYFVSDNAGQRVLQFLLSGGAELCAYCSQRGTVRSVSIAVPGQRVDIIDVASL